MSRQRCQFVGNVMNRYIKPHFQYRAVWCFHFCRKFYTKLYNRISYVLYKASYMLRHRSRYDRTNVLKRFLCPIWYVLPGKCLFFFYYLNFGDSNCRFLACRHYSKSKPMEWFLAIFLIPIKCCKLCLPSSFCWLNSVLGLNKGLLWSYTQ